MPIAVYCSCGKRIQAKGESMGRPSKCPSCGSVFVLFPVNVESGTQKVDYDATTNWNRITRFLIAIVTLALIFSIASIWLVIWNSANNRRDLADQKVARKVQAARSAVSRQEWDKAIKLLEEAIATKGTTEKEEVYRLLDEAKNSRIKHRFAQLLDSADAEISRGNIIKASQLLRVCQTSNELDQKERAAQMLSEIDFATSNDRARELLATLSEADLRAADEGKFDYTSSDIENILLRDIFIKTIQKNLPWELARRQAIHRQRDAELIVQKQREAREAAHLQVEMAQEAETSDRQRKLEIENYKGFKVIRDEIFNKEDAIQKKYDNFVERSYSKAHNLARSLDFSLDFERPRDQVSIGNAFLLTIKKANDMSLSLCIDLGNLIEEVSRKHKAYHGTPYEDVWYTYGQMLESKRNL